MTTQQAEKPRVAEWRRQVEELYGKIREWASEMEPRPTFETEPITIIEKWSGEYQIPQLIIRQGDDEMIVRPVAKAVVGAEGCVDLEGLDGPFHIYWHEKEPSPPMRRANGETIFERNAATGWFWMQDRTPWASFLLDGPLFRELAESCLR